MRETFEQRMIDVDTARKLSELAVRAEKHVSPKVHKRLMALASLVHHKVCVESCSLNDVMNAVGSTYQRVDDEGDTRLVDLPDEQTPAQRISAMDLRAKSETWLDRMLRRVGW